MHIVNGKRGIAGEVYDLGRYLDSVFGNGFGRIVRLFCKKGNSSWCAETAVWICCGSDGGCFCVVSVDSCNGNVGGTGKAGISSGGDWIGCGYVFLVSDRPTGTASAFWQREAGRAKKQACQNDYAGHGGYHS